MLCQKCEHNEADRYYMGNWNGSLFVAAFCSECVEEMGNQASSAGYGENFRKIIGWEPGEPVPRQDGEFPFPEQADPDRIVQFRLNALKYRLQDAANREDYAEAVRLRDCIARIEQGESCHES